MSKSIADMWALNSFLSNTKYIECITGIPKGLRAICVLIGPLLAHVGCGGVSGWARELWLVEGSLGRAGDMWVVAA